MNLAVAENNRQDIHGGNNQLVRHFTRKYFWKFIGCILSAVTYGNKGNNIWSKLKSLLVSRQKLNSIGMFMGTHTY